MELEREGESEGVREGEVSKERAGKTPINYPLSKGKQGIPAADTMICLLYKARLYIHGVSKKLGGGWLYIQTLVC